MQTLFEAIYDRPLDKRNFRKKLKSMPFLVKLNVKDKQGSRKGAFLYTFDHKEYEKASQNGFCFKLNKNIEIYPYGAVITQRKSI
jgi:hypothetical protein